MADLCGNCGHTIEHHGPHPCLGSDGCTCTAFQLPTPADLDPRDLYLDSLVKALGNCLDCIKSSLDTGNQKDVDIHLALAKTIHRAIMRLTK